MCNSSFAYFSCVPQWRQRLEHFGGMKYRPLIGGRRGCPVGPLPSILSIGVGNFLWCGGNQHPQEKRVRENVVSSSIHQGLGRSLSRQRMFRNLQTILNISVSFLCHILVDFLRTATDLPSLSKNFCCPKFSGMPPCPISYAYALQKYI